MSRTRPRLQAERAAAGAVPAAGPPAPTRSSPQRTRIVELYTARRPDSTVIRAGELGPVVLRIFPPALGWSPDGLRIKAPLKYSQSTAPRDARR